MRSNPNSTDQAIYRWWVPLTYTTNFTQLHKSSWLPYEQTSIRIANVAENNQWVIFNVDAVGTNVGIKDRNYPIIVSILMRVRNRLLSSEL